MPAVERFPDDLDLDVPEPVETRPGPTGGGGGRRLAAAGIVVLLVLVGALWVNQSDRQNEAQALTACVKSAERAGSTAQDGIGMMETYIQPALGSDISDQVRIGLFDLVRKQADTSLPAMKRARAGCASVTTRPWHGDLTDARTDYLAYYDALLKQTEATATDGGITLTENSAMAIQRAKALREVQKLE